MNEKSAVPHYTVTAGVVWDRSSSRVLIAKRRDDDARGGLWEFPGGKRERGESLEGCLTRELREELGIEVEVRGPFITVEHDYPDLRITLRAFHCRILRGEPKALACQDWGWAEIDDLSDYPFSAADEHIVSELQSSTDQHKSTHPAR